SDAIEQEYFRTDEALDTMTTAEDALIEDYLEGRLSSDDRVRFESHYLATDEHRTRVETIRRLSLMTGPATAPASSGGNVRLLALAASLVAIAGAGVWIAFSQSRGPEPAAPPVASPHATVFAFAVSPMTVRGNAETPALTVPPGIDLVELQFEASGNA